MLLVLNIQVIENLFLLDLSGVGVGVLSFEPRLPSSHLALLLLEQADQVFILIHQMGVLTE